jgi:hypothetical protein
MSAELPVAMLNKTAKKTNPAVVITAETAPNFDSGSAA